MIRSKTVRWVVIFSITIIFPLSASYAWNSEEKASGFSGSIQAGVGFLTSTDQLNPNSKNNFNENLDDDANRFSSIIPMVLFDLRYTFPGSGNQIYFGTPYGSEGPPGLSLGYVHLLNDKSELDFSTFGKPFERVWEDPYLIADDREATSRFTYGAKIEYKKIKGTDFEASYSISLVDVNEDEIGERFNDLERDGQLHDIRIAHSFQLNQRTALVPGFEFSIGDLDGDANSYLGYDFKLGLRQFSKSFSILLFLGVGLEDYYDEHPIFDKKREDVTYSIFGIFNLPNLFGKDYLFSNLLAGFQYRDSNIGFLDAYMYLGGLTIGVTF